MNVIVTFANEFQRHRQFVEKALEPLSDEQFLQRPTPLVNSVAILVKHLSGNLASRWTDFLSTDGEKPGRNRDGEFLTTDQDSRPELMAAWNRSWSTVANTLGSLSDDDLDRTVTIRNEPHTVLEALLRSIDHVAYHTGQIAYIARLLHSDGPWLTIAPGKSREYGTGSYLRPK